MRGSDDRERELDVFSGSGPKKKTYGYPIDPFRVWYALKEDLKTLLIALAIGTFVGFFIAKFVMGNEFNTSAMLRYEGPPGIPGLPAADLGQLGAAADALQVQSVLKEIKERTQFSGDLKALSNFIDYEVDYQTHVLRIDLSSDSGENVAKLAQTVTSVFLDHHEKLHAMRLKVELDRVQKRIAAARQEADAARASFESFRSKHGIADVTGDRRDIINTVATLKTKSELASSEIKALEARIATLQDQLSRIPKTTVVSAGGVTPLRAEYNKVLNELATARATLSDAHPRVQSLSQQAERLRAQLQAGADRGSTGGIVGRNVTYETVQQELRRAQANLESLRERQKGYDTLASKGQASSEAFSEIEGDAATLLADVKIKDTVVTDLQSLRARIEDSLKEPSSGFTVIDPGSAPEYGETNKLKYVVLLAFPMLFLLGVALRLLVREFHHLNLKTASEICYWGRAPVVASTAWPRDDHALEELIGDLDDVAPDSRGHILVVAANDADDSLAQELTRRLAIEWSPSGIITPKTAPEDPVIVTPQERDEQAETPAAQKSAETSPSQGVMMHSRQDHPLSPYHAALTLEVWTGPSTGQALRRASRLADRVIAIVPSGRISAPRMRAIGNRLGRQQGIAYIVIDLDPKFSDLPDRCGPVATFWQTLEA